MSVSAEAATAVVVLPSALRTAVDGRGGVVLVSARRLLSTRTVPSTVVVRIEDR